MIKYFAEEKIEQMNSHIYYNDIDLGEIKIKQMSVYIL